MVMSEDKAFSVLRGEMNKQGLNNWSIGFNNRKSSAGLTNLKKHSIVLSRFLLMFASDDQILDTMRHEIAHAIDYEQRGFTNHDRFWKLVARRVGANPQRVVEDDSWAKKIPSKYTYVCERCGYSVNVNRRLKNMDHRFCGVCYRKGFKNSHFIIKQNW